MKRNWKQMIGRNQLFLMLCIAGIVFFAVTDNRTLFQKLWNEKAGEAGEVWRSLRELAIWQGRESKAGTESIGDERSSQNAAQNGPGGGNPGSGQGVTGQNTEGEGEGISPAPGDTGEGTDGDGSGRENQSAEDGTGSAEPKWQRVEDDYFDDALFIGDSRVVGLQDYGKLEGHATFYASTGLNIFKLLSARIAVLDGQRKKVSVEEALAQKQFRKIYLMVGINELDIGTVDRFEETYRERVARIMELQPDAIIYIQSIMLVTEKRAAKGDYVTNAGIRERNERIQKIADNDRIFYLNVNEAVCDESGGMNPEYTTDGVHLKVKYIPLWTDYLKNHAVSEE